MINFSYISLFFNLRVFDVLNNTHRLTPQEVVDTSPARHQPYSLQSFFLFIYFFPFSLCILICILLFSFFPFN